MATLSAKFVNLTTAFRRLWLIEIGLTSVQFGSLSVHRIYEEKKHEKNLKNIKFFVDICKLPSKYLLQLIFSKHPTRASGKEIKEEKKRKKGKKTLTLKCFLRRFFRSLPFSLSLLFHRLSRGRR